MSETQSLDYFEVFPWSSKFETGIDIIDKQHQRLVQLLNQLANAIVHDDVLEHRRIFDELTAYAEYHFETEEAIWKKNLADDEWTQRHCQEHRKFLPDAMKLKTSASEHPSREELEQILKYLMRWLATHIVDGDMRMALVVKLSQAGLEIDDAKRSASEQMQSAARLLIDAVLIMYDALSSRTLDLMRERLQRQEAQDRLKSLNRELEKLATTDQLTGLLNRRSFDEIFSRELRRAQRVSSNLVFIMLDIDYFKRLNDLHGHAAGDQALATIGNELNRLFRRPGDFVFRLGGEEFGVLITDPEFIDGSNTADRIRRKIAALEIPNLGSDIGDFVTISAGMVEQIPDISESVESFFKLADQRLYQAKTEGRNRVVSAD
ncbi:diguanylate cyclase [Pseudomaricurvus alkylphenolicus]|jgi:diguanylate cyclase (GGDEF)-like protein/hemerythrin-like metal-binding protein|uniref:GGDEF domain-containing protein n=1 Tax=Pseudomaricurvus alkylphenolicus TaxID=1306991 RepID=UPI00141F3BE8|nr:diguanylate cyclase [Pseudomaricurvus alkylphenolicus]NIB41003.1 diguanylate cyclase [Pseudomaricurvus alkylphenolicus]